MSIKKEKNKSWHQPAVQRKVLLLLWSEGPTLQTFICMQIDCPGSVNFLHSDCADSWTLQALSSQVLFLQSHINLLTVSNLNQILEINLVLLQDLNTYIINLKAPSLSKRPPQIFLPLCSPKNIIWAKELTFRSTKYRICTHNFSANEEISFLQDGENTKLYVMAYFAVHFCI